MILFGSTVIFCQESKTVRITSGTSVEMRTFEVIPKATGPCTPPECEWWKRLREVGNNLLRKEDIRLEREFIALFVQGIEKSYNVPIDDRPYQVISAPKPMPPAPGRPRNGKVELAVQVRADGSVGEIRVLTSIRQDMDEQCILVKKQTIYLPAVQARKFVSAWRNVGCGFWFKNGIN